MEFPPQEAFRDWLLSLPEDIVVADDWNCCNCPLAEWLLVTGVFEAPYIRPDKTVAQSCWRPSGSNHDQNLLPQWANKFGHGIDALGKSRSSKGYGFGPVTAADCLNVLRSLPGTSGA